ARSGPPVLAVVAALCRPRRRALDDRLAECLQERCEGAGQLDRGRLVRDADLERAKARVRPNVPPEAGVAVREPEPDEALDERLTRRVGAEVRCRSGAGQ